MSLSSSTIPHQPEPTQKRQSPESIPQTDTNTAAGVQENPEEKKTSFEQHSQDQMKDRDADAKEEEREEEEEEEEEEGECGFCLFMKGGGCKETFVEWEKCIEEAEEKKEDVVAKCFQATTALKNCMEAHSDYYAPILQAEKSLEEEAIKQLDEEKEKEKEKEKEETLGANNSKNQA